MITGFHLIAWKSALKLEIKGLKRSRGPSAYSLVKRHLGFKGSREKVLEQLETYIQEVIPRGT